MYVAQPGSLRIVRFALLVSLWLFGSVTAMAADLEDAEKLFEPASYDACLRMVDEELDNGAWSEPWRVLKIRTELIRGKDAEALAALEDALRRFPASVQLHLVGREVYRYNGRDQDAVNALDAIERMVAASPRRFSNAPGLIALGRFFLIRGADSKKVLDQFYDPVTKQQPDFIEGHLATAELALDKEDYALAADTLRKAPEAAALDPRFHYLLALALSAEDRAGSAKELAQALKINPRHVDSLLLEADHLIDSEKYAEAAQVLKQVFDVNPKEPRAWALQAVLAHLRGDNDGEAAARKSAMARWAANPEVDHLIGRKLSQKYRFAEGAACQKRALALDAEYQPAKIQLCQDLLRLGDETEGWKLAAEIFGKDGYNVVAYNLVTLRDRLAGFRTIEGDGFVVRMEGREADLYGQRVLSSARRARKTLCEKYEVTLTFPGHCRDFPSEEGIRRPDFRPAGGGRTPGRLFWTGDHGQ